MTLSEIPMNTSGSGGTGGGGTGKDDGGQQQKRLPFVRSNVDEVMGWAGGIWGRVGGGMPQWALQSSVQSYVSKIPRRDEFGVKWGKDDDDGDDEGNRKRGREVAADLARTDSDSEEQTSSDYDETSSSESEDEDEGPFVDPSKAVQRANQRQSLVNAKAKALKSARCTSSAKPASSQQQPAAAARTSGRSSSSSSAASASAISASNSASAKAIASALRNPAVNISYDGAIRPFPESVHAMVTETAAEDPTLIAWVKDGEAFAVKDTGPRLAPVLQKFFRHTKYSSLQRQLNIYGWTKCTDGRYKGAFYNPEFHRDLAIANLEGIVRRPPPSRQRGSSRSKPSSSRASGKGDDKRESKGDRKERSKTTAKGGGKGINSSKKLEQLAAARAAKKAKKRKRSSF